MHGLDKTQIVHNLCGVRQQFTEPRAGLSMLRELEDRLRDRKACLPRGHRRQPLAVPDRVGQVGAMSFYEVWFVIEQIELRRSAALEHINDALGFRGKMRQPCKTARRARVSDLSEEVGVQQFS